MKDISLKKEGNIDFYMVKEKINKEKYNGKYIITCLVTSLKGILIHDAVNKTVNKVTAL
jgi:hypothetical protein